MSGMVLRSQDELLRAVIEAPAATTWAYVRVSSDKQDVDGYGLEMQVSAINEFCRNRGLKPPVIVEEVASAGKPALPVRLGASSSDPVETSPRPLLLTLLGRLQEISTDQLVVWRLDRLARLSYEQDMFVELLRRRGVRIHSVQVAEGDALGSDDPAKNLLRHVLSAFAQYEKAIIQARMAAGLRAKASRGGWTGGQVPTGYRRKDRDLEVDPDVGDSVRKVYYWRHKHGLTIREICDALNTSGAAGSPWNRARVHRVLSERDLYSGIYKDPFGQCHQRPDLRILPDDLNDIADQIDVSIPSEQP